MAYRLKRKKSIQHNLQRIAQEQIDRAIIEITDPELESHKAVHQVRKRCKKLRGLIRLVRPSFGDYAFENAFLRDTARNLSGLRDAQTILNTFKKLAQQMEQPLDTSLQVTITDRLEQRRQDTTYRHLEMESRLARFAERMQLLQHRVNDWQLDKSGFRAVKKGLIITYGRGRKAIRKAYTKPSTARFHEWRKLVKYHWYHARLLQPIWPLMMDVEIVAADELSDLLGDEHDLAVLSDTLKDEGALFSSPEQMASIIAVITQQRTQLQQQCLPLGKRLFAEKPKHLARRLHAYWKS
ncbi:MAG: CHAD domain-containing protein [Gammaproteobacteria bacterium]|nr:CHAD domain-containing protein [Gammaproteobacteria bacterium]